MKTIELVKKMSKAVFAKDGDTKEVTEIRQVKDGFGGKMIWVCNPDYLMKMSDIMEYDYLDVAIDALEVRGYTLQK